MAYRRAAVRAWLNGPSRLPPGEHDPPLDWPQFCMSDNASTALAVTSALKMFRARCACHVLYIPVRVLLWHRRWPRGSKSPRVAPVGTTLRELVHGFEQLRAWAWAFKDQSNRKEWCRLACGGKQHKRLYVDSNAKWKSSERLAERATEEQFRDDMARMKHRNDHMPDLPTQEQFLWLLAAVTPLAIIGFAMDKLQKDDARAAQVVPVVTTVLHQLALGRDAAPPDSKEHAVHAAFHDQVQKSLDDHMNARFLAPAGPKSDLEVALSKSDIKTWWELCEVAALMQSGPLEAKYPYMGLHMRKVRASLENFCMQVDRIAHPGQWLEGGGSLEAAPAAPAAAVVKKAKTEKPNSPSSKARQAMAKAMPKGPGTESSDPRLTNPREIVAAKVRSLLTSPALPGTDNGRALCAWWYSPAASSFERIRPAARILNSFAASNGRLERRFGKSSEFWADPRKIVSKGLQLPLETNGPQLGMPGYSDLGDVPMAGQSDSDFDALEAPDEDSLKDSDADIEVEVRDELAEEEAEAASPEEVEASLRNRFVGRSVRISEEAPDVELRGLVGLCINVIMDAAGAMIDIMVAGKLVSASAACCTVNAD